MVALPLCPANTRVCSVRQPPDRVSCPIPAAMRRRRVSRSIETTTTSIVLEALHVTHSDKAQDGERPAAGPSSPAPRQPRRLVVHANEMTLVVGPGLRLNCERDAGRRERHRIDVPAPPPWQRMTQPPPLRLKRRQRAPDFVLRASSHAAATSQPNPVASVEPEPERRDEQGAGCRDGSRARDGQRQQHSRTARHRRHSSSRQPAVLLAARVVQPALSWIHGMRSSSHRHPTAPPHATLASSAVLDSIISGVSSGRSST
jgi:hypothetical protein